MKKVYKDLKALIDYLQKEYTKTTTVWKKSDHANINQKRSLVIEIDSNGKIYQAISEYVQLLNEVSAEITLSLSTICQSKVTARVKAQNSIEFKIENYKSERHEYGQVPINKCVNDLFGIRIILDSSSKLDDVMEYIDFAYSGKYKCINSSKNDYRAIHLYFKEDNYSFQWELQIWNDCDVDGNFASHKKYKQEYTTWEKESKEGGLIDG